MNEQPTQPTPKAIIGHPDLLARLRVWAEPMVGPIPAGDLLLLQEIIEQAAAGTNYTPMYRIEVS